MCARLSSALSNVQNLILCITIILWDFLDILEQNRSVEKLFLRIGIVKINKIAFVELQ